MGDFQWPFDRFFFHAVLAILFCQPKAGISQLLVNSQDMTNGMTMTNTSQTIPKSTKQ